MYNIIMRMDDSNNENTNRYECNDEHIILGRVQILYDDWTHIYEQKSGKYVQKLVTLTEI